MQHGDYHTGNMMLCGGRLFVIDFDRPDWGDPWEGVQPDPLGAPSSPPPSPAAWVEGYFDGAPPVGRFGRLLALYIANNTLGSLPWAIPFGEGEIATMKKTGGGDPPVVRQPEKPGAPLVRPGMKKARQPEKLSGFLFAKEVTG